MRKRTSFRFFSVLLAIWLCAVSFAQAQAVEGSLFNPTNIDRSIPSSKQPKIVVFLPTLTADTEYASMIVQAFKNYFVDKLAFSPQDRQKADIDIILVTQDPSQPVAQPTAARTQGVDVGLGRRGDTFYFDTRGMRVISGINDQLRQTLKLPEFAGKNDDAVLLLLDGKNRVVMRDEHYRGQGEHLKPLEYRVKKLLNVSVPSITTAAGKPLAVGQPAPDVQLDNGKRVSDYRGQVLVLSFYPAAFSGVLNIQNLELARQQEMISMMSCAVQIQSLDSMARNVRTFALSESTPELLARWQSILVTRDIQYINDSDYSAAQTYGAYDAQQGYNRRVTAVIDRQGRIAYLDQDYRLDQESKIRSITAKLAASN